jgi:hypothetical protein
MAEAIAGNLFRLLSIHLDLQVIRFTRRNVY